MNITDSIRLDWLINNHAVVEEHLGDFWVYGNVAYTEIPTQRSARAAIDAAIRAERAGSGGRR